MGRMKRVVVTGMGAISPLGLGVEHNWKRLIAGDSGISRITAFPTDGLPSRIAGQVPRGTGAGELDFDSLSKQLLNRNDIFIVYTMIAGKEALEQARWTSVDEQEAVRTAVIIGSGIGGFQTQYAGSLSFAERGMHALSPYFIPAQLINLASGQIAIEYGFRGPNYSVVSACATGAEAIASGARAIQLDEADVAVVGGADAVIHPLVIAGFCRARALSTGFNDTPEAASRPFDTGRDGFVLAEGAGVLVLEEREHALARGAEILGEVAGYASGSDAFHITATHPEGVGEQQTLRQAMQRAGITPEQVGYVNAHATSTPVGDAGELGALQRVFGDRPSVAVSSTKSAIGHTLGAAGALEAIYTMCALRSGMVPPTLNLEKTDEAFSGFNLVPREAQQHEMQYAISNAFGFGSTKATLVFSKP